MELKISLEEKSLIVSGLKEFMKTCEQECEVFSGLKIADKWSSYISFKQQQIACVRELLKRLE